MQKGVSKFKLVEQFCLIQLQVLSDREVRLKRELQDCIIQREFLSHFLTEVNEDESFNQLNALIREVKIIEDE